MDITKERTYREQLRQCIGKLRCDDGQDAVYSAHCLVDLGNTLSILGELPGALRCYQDAFKLIHREPEEEGIYRFSEFYTVQFTLYILGKRDKQILSIAEGDMIYDLIHQKWEQLMEELGTSQFSFVCSDLRRWYASVVIDFPYELCDLLQCHSDTKDLRDYYHC